jgi:phosphatidylinositol-3-phosphatase
MRPPRRAPMSGWPRWVGLLCLALIAAACGGSSQAQGASGVRPSSAHASRSPAPAAQGSVPHVLVLLEENRDYESVIGNPQAPFLNGLARQYGLATDWYGITHPSLPNYLALVSGSVQGVSGDVTPSPAKLPGTTLVDQLAERGIGWKAYMEDMPRPCDTTDTYSPGNYDVNHNPFVYFRSITESAGQCQRVVPYGQLATDLASNTAPPFLWVTPNTLHNMHDTGVREADDWARDLIGRVQASQWYRAGGVVLITWDEGEPSDRIPTIVVSDRTPRAARLSTRGNHYGTLRALEETYGLSYLGAAGAPTSGDLRPLFGG